MDLFNGPVTWPVQFDPKGRILIPADARNDVGWASKDELVLWRTDDGFEIIPRDQFARRVQNYFKSKFGKDRKLVDELIAERQMEAQFEEGHH